jgi:hypothetical protein
VEGFRKKKETKTLGFARLEPRSLHDYDARWQCAMMKVVVLQRFLHAIDRLVHRATILEMNVDRCRRKEAVEKARSAGPPPTRATIKGSS